MIGSGWTLLVIGCLINLHPCSGELKLVQTVFRHGNRAPLSAPDFYPNDPYVNDSYEPMGHGGLTNKGKMSVYQLGLFFRKKYGSFLGNVYKDRIVQFRADEVERVIMTAELVAAAMFPPTKSQRWNARLDWQPIPVWYKPLKEDILYTGISCPNYEVWRQEVETNDEDVLKWIEDHADLYEYLSEHTGGNITQRSSFLIRQQLKAQSEGGLKLPEWTKAVFPNGTLDDLAIFDMIIQAYTEEMQQLLAGAWIQEWLGHVENHINGSDTRKAYMYAGHELNIAPILIALENFDYHLPSYSSTLMFELHKQYDQYYVQVNHYDSGNYRTLSIPGCDGKMCPLETFKEVTAHLIPKDLKALCGGWPAPAMFK